MPEQGDLVVVGYAKVPRTSGAYSSHEVLAVSLRVDRRTGTVTEADATVVSNVVRSWLADVLVGADITGDPAPVLALIDDGFLSNASGSVKQAVIDAWRRFAAHHVR